MNAVNWFEIATTDLARAKKFYGEVLNIEFQDMDMGDGMLMAMFPWNHEEPGSAGALVHNKEWYKPSQEGTVVYFSVDSVADALVRAKNAGGTPITESMSIGEHGFVGMFIDSEGNRVAFHSTNQ